MSTPKISIIVPVYNAEKTLRRCVDSILSQKFQDFELILVNDGSKDSSGAICEEYAKANHVAGREIYVLHQKNSGVAAARNLGLSKASGELVMFVDSDDCLMPNALSLPYDEFNEDIVFLSYKFMDNDQEKVISLPDEIVTDIPAYFNDRIVELYARVPWTKLFRRSALKNLRFNTNMRIGEDTVFTLNALAQTKSARLSSHMVYQYFNNECDLMTKYALKPEEGFYLLRQLLQAQSNLVSDSVEFKYFVYWISHILTTQNDTVNLAPWYSNKEVIQLYKQTRSFRSRKHRILFFILSHLRMNFLLMPISRLLKSYRK